MYNKNHYWTDLIWDQKKEEKNKNKPYWVSKHQKSTIDTSKYDCFVTFDVLFVDIL